MKIYLFIICMSIFSTVFAQEAQPNHDIIYLFDKQDNPVNTIGEAATIQVVSKENDTCYTVRYYKNYGTILWQQSFKDSSLSIENGRFVWYNDYGTVDSTGCMWNNKKNGVWQYFDSTAQEHLMNNKQPSKKIKKNFVSALSPELTVSKYFNYGIEIQNDQQENINLTVDLQSLFTDKTNWIKYLKENISPTIGTYNSVYNTAYGNDAVEIVSFTIDKNGVIQDIYFLHSDGYAYDKELLRVLHSCGRISLSSQKHVELPVTLIQKFIFTHQFK